MEGGEGGRGKVYFFFRHPSKFRVTKFSAYLVQNVSVFSLFYGLYWCYIK